MRASETENRPSTDSHGRNGFFNLHWMIVVGGFAGGILGGAFLLSGAGKTESPVEAPAEPVVARTSQAEATDAKSARLEQEVTDIKRELESEKLRLEVERLRGEISNLKNSKRQPATRSHVNNEEHESETEVERPNVKTPAKPTVSAGEATLAYWNALNHIIVSEATMRSAPADGLSASNAGDFLNRRVSAARFASSAIRKLDKQGVDQDVVTIGGKLARWYDDNASVAGKGGNLLGADAASRQGQAGKQYQASERSLQQSVASINRDGEQVRVKMSRKYGLDFPKLQ